MLNNNITSLNGSYGDKSNYDPSIVFPSKFSITTTITSDMDCISIWGPVSNLNCPNEYPDCNCPLALKDIRPSFSEPSIDELKAAKPDECYQIRTTFSPINGFQAQEYINWGGIDYSNKNATYNCLGSTEYGNWYSSTENALVQGLTLKSGLGSPVNSTFFPYASRKTKSDGVFTDNAWYVPDTNSILDSDPELKTKADAVTFGKNFPFYLEYSKTNATFWNTPETTPLYRQAQVALLKYQRIKILVNGDFTVKPGELINIENPATNRLATTLKTRFEGKWMVYRVERIIKPGKHSMYLYLMRDYPYMNPGINPNFNILVNKKDK